ncbi:MAG: hypothetical protein GWN87_27700 [Desulfuromonadales bacterium]|nr:hypothetical protein [Desulfuromonadales bacterium]
MEFVVASFMRLFSTPPDESGNDRIRMKSSTTPSPSFERRGGFLPLLRRGPGGFFLNLYFLSGELK